MGPAELRVLRRCVPSLKWVRVSSLRNPGLLSKKERCSPPMHYRNNRLLTGHLIKVSTGMCGHAFFKHPAGNLCNFRNMF